MSVDIPPSDAPRVQRLNEAFEPRYRIEGEVGRGAMAFVYLAEDLRHGRQVALKVLKPDLASAIGPERFLREIRTTARLQHPNILPLHDSGEADGFLYYVMPFVEGESLRERIDREHQFPVADAVRIATEVAEALEYAHDHGVVHRDIKPANILLQSGHPLVADFGIAIALSAAIGSRMTGTGMSVGTPHYMSPEQASGDEYVTAATDVHALGCILYEMLLGEPPFTGATAQAILARVMTSEPRRVTTIRQSVPAHIDSVIVKSLEKVPSDRFATAGDFRKALLDPTFRHGEGVGSGTSALRSIPAWQQVLPWAIVTLLAAALIIVLQPTTVEPHQLREPLGPSGDLRLGGREGIGLSEYRNTGLRPSHTSLAISPDGRTFAYSARPLDAPPRVDSRLYIRRLDDAVPRAVEGLEGTRTPFFSPDGTWLGVTTDDGVYRVHVRTGRVETVGMIGHVNGALWTPDGDIIVAADTDSDTPGLHRIPASGGDWTEIEIQEERNVPIHPHLLPGGRAIVYAVNGVGALAVASLEDGSVTDLGIQGWDPHYVHTGHLLFLRNSTLYGVRFDPDALRVIGTPTVVRDSVMLGESTGDTRAWRYGGQYALSDEGDLLFAAETPYQVRARRFIEIRADGTRRPISEWGDGLSRFSLSPDRTRLAGDRDNEVWIFDLERRILERITPTTPEFELAHRPEWSPDGQWLFFRGTTAEAKGIFVMRADGRGPAELVLEDESNAAPGGWAPGIGTLYGTINQGILAFMPGQPPRPLLPPSGERVVWFGASPDGQWLYFTSDILGFQELFVVPMDDRDTPPQRVTNIPALMARWPSHGRSIYFRVPSEWAPDSVPTLMRIDVAPGDSFRASPPEVVVRNWGCWTNPRHCYDVLPDGTIITVEHDLAPRDERAPRELNLFIGWAEELETRLPR